MKLWVLCCFVLAVAAAPPDIKPGVVELVNYDSNIGTDGFKYTFKQSDGTRLHATGKLVKVVTDGEEKEVLVIKGAYSYINNGIRYTVQYEADQDGYRATVAESPSEELPGGVSPLVVATLLGGGG